MRGHLTDTKGNTMKRIRGFAIPAFVILPALFSFLVTNGFQNPENLTKADSAQVQTAKNYRGSYEK